MHNFHFNLNLLIYFYINWTSLFNYFSIYFSILSIFIHEFIYFYVFVSLFISNFANYCPPKDMALFIDSINKYISFIY